MRVLVRAEAEACRESDRRADDVIGQVQAEIDGARQRGLDEDREIRRRGEEHMAAAVDEIVRGVLRE